MAGFVAPLLQAINAYLQIRAQGGTGVRLKDSAGALLVRDFADANPADAQSKSIAVQGTNATNNVKLTAPAALGSSYTVTWPGALPGSTQFMQMSSAGLLSLASTTNTFGLYMQTFAFTQATGSPLALFTPPANGYVFAVMVNITVASGTNAATINLGTSGSPSALNATTDFDLTVAATQVDFMVYPATGSPAALQMVITPAAQTFTGTVSLLYGGI